MTGSDLGLMGVGQVELIVQVCGEDVSMNSAGSIENLLTDYNSLLGWRVVLPGADHSGTYSTVVQ